MADNLTDAAELLALNFLFNAQTATRPTLPLKLALSTSAGSDTTAGTEVTGGSYARQTVVFGAASAGAVATTADVVFTGMPATTITGIEIYDSAGTPVRLAYGTLSASKTTNSGDTFTIATGNLTISLA